MKLFNELTLKFEKTDWAHNPEFGLIDVILEEHPEYYEIFNDDIRQGCKSSEFGRKDTPTVEQIVRARYTKR